MSTVDFTYTILGAPGRFTVSVPYDQHDLAPGVVSMIKSKRLKAIKKAAYDSGGVERDIEMREVTVHGLASQRSTPVTARFV